MKPSIALASMASRWDPFRSFLLANLGEATQLLMVLWSWGRSSFPTARWRLLNSKITLRAFLRRLLLLLLASLPPRLLASFGSQWALLDLNCQLPIPVGAAGPRRPSPGVGGRCWTLTGDLLSPVGTAGPQQGTSRAQWAPLDLKKDVRIYAK